MSARGVLLALLIVGAAAATPIVSSTPPANASATALPRGASVAVIGVPGWQWSDLSDLHGADPGLVSVRGESESRTTELDGWAMVSAGSRISASKATSSRKSDDPALAAALEAQKPALPAKRHLGRLYDAAHAVGSCVAAGPVGYARLAASGRAGIADAVSVSAEAALASSCRVAVVEVSAADAMSAATTATDAGRSAIVVGISDRSSPALHPILWLVPGSSASNPMPRWLTSPSTRRAGYVQLIDIAPTVAALLGAPAPKQVDGEPMTTSRAGPAATLRHLSVPQRMRALANQAVDGHRSTPWVVTILLGVGLAASAMAGRRRAWALRCLGAMPAGCFLVGAQPYRGLGEVVIAAGAAAAIATMTRTPQGVGAATLLVLAADVVSGARWQIDTPLGYSPLVAGRFAGLGNLAFGVLAAAALVAASGRRRRWMAALLLVAIAIDGAPMWGADLGGTLALVPAGLVLLGVRGGRLVLAGVAGAVAAVGFAALDLLRPAPSRTHLGRFAQRVLDGDATAVIERKLIAGADLVIHSPLTILGLVVAVAVLVLANLSAGDGPHAPLIKALSVAGVLGFALNDSGLAAAVTLVWVAVPLVSAATRPPEVSRVGRGVLP